MSTGFCVFGGFAFLDVIAPGGLWRFLWYPPILLTSWFLGYALSSRFTLPVERRLRGQYRLRD
jgi:hypothetical protein